MELWGYVACLFIGIILGILGGGGSILAIPILVYLFHIDVVMASAYSLFIVGTTSLIGAIPKYKDGLVSVKTGILFGLPSIITIFYTRKWFVPALPDVLFNTECFTVSKRALILGVFALLMIITSFSMIKGRKEIESDTQRKKIFLLIVQGLFVGLLTGLVGAGGGFLIIPALVLLSGLKFRNAVGTSLFIIAINSLTGFLGDVLNYTIPWTFLLTITMLAVVGIFIGIRVSKQISQTRLRIAFGWFVLVMGCWILVKELLL